MPKKELDQTKLVAGSTPLSKSPASVADFNEIIAVLSSQTAASAQLGKRGAEDQSGSSGTSSKDREKKTTSIIKITNLFTALFH